MNSADALIAAAEAGLGILASLSYQVMASVLARQLGLGLINFTPEKLPVSAIILCTASPRPTSALL